MTIVLPRLDRSTAAERGLTLADFLVPVRLAERTPTRVRHIVLIAIGVAIVALSARIYIPTSPVPFTGQTLGVLVVGGALGFRRGAAALLVYLAIGALGVPVYAQGDAGVDVVLGARGGYLIGFVVAAAVVGRLAELGWDRHLGGAFAMMLIGTSIIYALGVPWLKVVTGMSWTEAVAGGLTPFLVWDTAKLAIAAVLFPTAWWLIGRRPDDR
jgi:biotin transport system substrate-specific component